MGRPARHGCGRVQRWSVASHVHTADRSGGLGIVTALTQPNPEALRKAIAETRRLTDKPFGPSLHARWGSSDHSQAST